MINKIKFNINTNFDGTAIYKIYDSFDCGLTGGTVTYTGTTEVVNNIGIVVIENIELTENLSIHITDSNGCEFCQNQTVENFGDCTPFTGSATYVEPEELLYYELNACDESQPPLSTLLQPAGIGQRYILPFPTEYYYTWGGDTTTDDSIFNGSIQRIDGEFSCPS
jgi:hypothetical protein